MTQPQAKQEIAAKYECLNWDELKVNIQLNGEFREQYKLTWTSVSDEAAELYAKSKWEEACEKCAKLAGEDGEAYILNNKPEFTP